MATTDIANYVTVSAAAATAADAANRLASDSHETR